MVSLFRLVILSGVLSCFERGLLFWERSWLAGIKAPALQHGLHGYVLQYMFLASTDMFSNICF